MKTQSILVYLAIIVGTVNAETKLRPVSLTTISSPEDRRKLPLFPKSIKKYVFTEKPVYKATLSTLRATVMTKRTLMPRLSITNNDIKDTTTRYRQPVTRQPLMKLKKFTIDLPWMEPEPETIMNDSQSETFYLNSDESIQSTESLENDYSSKEDDYIPTEQAYIKSVENVTENTNETEENVANNAIEVNLESNFGSSNKYIEEYDFTTESEPSELSETENNRLENNQMDTEGNTILDSIFISQEKKDQMTENDINEFIFIKKIDIDTTKTKKKRSANIIEEENTGTTISGYKYTGRESHLTNNLSYKNINK